MRCLLLLGSLLCCSTSASADPRVLADASLARAENLARRARVSASESQEGYLPELAVDGDRATRWSGIPGHNAGVWYELAWDAEVAVSSLLLFQYDRYVEELDLAAWDAATQSWHPFAHLGRKGARLPRVVVWRGPPVRTTKLRVADITNGPSFTEVEAYADPLPFDPVVELASDLRGRFVGIVTDPFGAAPLAGAAVTLRVETPLGPREILATTDEHGLFFAPMPVGLRGSVQVHVVPPKGATASEAARASFDATFDAARFGLGLTPNSIDRLRAERAISALQGGDREAGHLPAPDEVSWSDGSSGWRVAADPGDGFEKVEFDDRAWSSIPEPSHFAMHSLTCASGIFAARRRFVAQRPPGQRLKLRFDGVYSGAEVWVNGHLVAEHEGGATPFETDVTDVVGNSGDNLLALRVREHTTTSDRLDRMSQYADFPLAGIMRKVTLFSVPELHVGRLETETDVLAAPEHGRTNGLLRARIVLRNESGETRREVNPRIALIAPDGTPIPIGVSLQSGVELSPWSEWSGELSLQVPDVMTWDQEHPRLYSVRVAVNAGAQRVQTLEERIGFRQIEVRGPQLLANGRPIKLSGTCHHDSDPLRGRAVTVEREVADVMQIRAANLNALRTSHYPPLPELLYAADALGLWVEDEASFCWVDSSDDLRLAPRILQLTAELLARDRNHPSVFMWSLCNESQFGWGFERSHEMVRASDPTRPTGAAISAWLEIATLHNPITLARIEENEHIDLPLLFDESECIYQGIFRDVAELWVDPGIRDYYVTPMPAIWNRVQSSRATQGSFIWCFADDLFLVPGRGLEYGRGFTASHFVDESLKLPGRGIVGDAPWGFVDGWRREKPEFLHVRNLHCPVVVPPTPLPIIASGQELVAATGGVVGMEIHLPVENRFDFTDLSELQFQWGITRKELAIEVGVARTQSPPHSKGELVIPVHAAPQPGDVLQLRVGRDPSPRGLIASFLIPIGSRSPPSPPRSVVPADPPPALALLDESTLAGEAIRVVGRGFEIAFDRGSGQLRRCVAGGEPLLLELPAPHLLPTSHPLAPLPDRSTWHCTALKVERDGDGVRAEIDGSYTDFTGGLDWRISADGSCRAHVHYRYGGAELDAREVGASLSLPRSCERLAWQRTPDWPALKDDLDDFHIGRAIGVTTAFPAAALPPAEGATMDALTGFLRQRPWSLDPSPMGCNDFRSTKRSILWALLQRSDDVRAPGTAPGLLVQGDGKLAVRASVEPDRVRLHVNDWYGGTGAGWWEWESNYGRGRHLKAGDEIDLTLEFRLGEFEVPRSSR